MQKKQSNYERIILALVSLAALGVAGWLITLVLGFPDTLQAKSVTPRNEAEPPPNQRVVDAIDVAKREPKLWVAPVRNNKAVPLNKSVLLALKGEEIIDMFLENPRVREEMSNQFLRENNLEWQHPNVGELDPDDDGFTNLEEFTKETKPKDARSHPPITDKLFMVERIAKDYNIILKNPTGQISLPEESGIAKNRKTYFLNLQAVGTEPHQMFGGTGDRFRAVKWEVKKIPDPRLGEKDVSELTIEEVVDNKRHVLVLGVPTNLAEYSARFEFRLKQITGLPPVAKDGTFRIPGYEATTYKVLQIMEDKAVVAPLDAAGNPGKEVIINKG